MQSITVGQSGQLELEGSGHKASVFRQQRMLHTAVQFPVPFTVQESRQGMVLPTVSLLASVKIAR